MSKRKESPDNVNSDFCTVLHELAEYERNVNKNIHKYNAYRNDAATLANHPKRIKTGDEAKSLKGIGAKIAMKIDEIIDTGKLKKLEDIRADDEVKSINELVLVTGIGPTKAKQLVDQGITSVADLENHKNKLNSHQLIGLKHYEDFLKRIPRSEIEEIENLLDKQIRTIDSKYEFTICGSYRRGAKDSGDVDVLVSHPDYVSSDGKQTNILKNIVNYFKEKKIITDTISHGDAKFMGVCKLDSSEIYRRLDIRLIPKDQFACGILYFTGSDQFNKNMRAHALDKGFTLNEYCLRPVGSTGVVGEAVPISSEEEIFEYLDYEYKEPHERSM